MTENMGYMFYTATAFNQDIGSWDTANTANMYQMFYGASAFNQDIGSWNTANTVNMSSMFYSATAFDQDLGTWNVDLLTDAADMFLNVTLSTTNYDSLLIGWEDHGTSSVQFHGGSSQYSAGAAATARADMVGRSWSITDGGEE